MKKILLLLSAMIMLSCAKTTTVHQPNGQDKVGLTIGNYTKIMYYPLTSTTTTTVPSTTTTTTTTTANNDYRGVNLAGAEFSEGRGTYGTTYIYPTTTEAQYYVDKGFNFYRIPFNWENMQTSLNAPLNTTELGRLKTLVNYLTSKGKYVLIDVHNYARYDGKVIGTSAVPNSAFADFWTKMANEFKANSFVLFDLMNEPNTMPVSQWLSAANAATAAIRATGATNKIMVPATDWDGSGDWISGAMNGFKDPGNNWAVQVHSYLDADSSGAGTECVSSTIGSQRLSGIVSWLRANGKKGYLGEFGVPNTSTCKAAVDNLLKYLQTNKDVMLGWSYWAGGTWWWGNDKMTINPTSTGADKPQMSWLLPYLPGSTTTTTNTTTSTSTTTVQYPITFSVVVNSQWSTGYCYQVNMTNSGSTTIPLKGVDVDLTDNTVINFWGAKPNAMTGKTTLVPFESWTSPIPSNSSWTNFGFCVNKGVNPITFVSLK